MNGIKNWAQDDRPREKMQAMGADALSKAELLAILIGSGVPGLSAVDLMRQILADYNFSLKQLGKASVEDLCRYKGMGPAKALTILAACQLGQLRLQETVEERKKITCSRDIYEYFLPLMQDLQHEECHLLLLRQNMTVIGQKTLSKGGLTYSAFDVRVMLKEAILADATVLALCHNHPSGNASPSKMDDDMTKVAFESCKTMQLRLVDHIILTDGNFYSYQDNTRIVY